jgi:hypothetical protein
MNERKVISGENLPMRMPLYATLLAWLVLDKVQAPGWLWGAIGLALVLLWIIWIIDVVYRKDVDIFTEENKGK